MILLFIFLFAKIQSEEPWGPDHDLAYRSIPVSCPRQENTLQRLGALLINFHQDVISPADGPRSHFYPSSSQYTKEAMRQHGFFKGFFLGCDRLMRENDDPWIYPSCIGPEGNCLKFDPIPLH